MQCRCDKVLVEVFELSDYKNAYSILSFAICDAVSMLQRGKAKNAMACLMAAADAAEDRFIRDNLYLLPLSMAEKYDGM